MKKFIKLYLMNLYNKVTNFIKNQDLIEPGSVIIIGLSGGPDSVCLLSLLNQARMEHNYKLIAVHIDHEWRSNSSQDAQFCRNVASQFNIPYIERKASEIVFSKKYNGSKEEMGRLFRRSILENVAKENNASAIALAHHQDDQQETFFLRMIRGASIAGLASMRSRHGLYVRPLLPCYKSEILKYLHDNKLTFVIDHTNESNDFLRNSLRHKVLPALKSCDKRFDQTFIKTLNNIQQADRFIERMVQTRFDEISYSDGTTKKLNIKYFFQSDPFLYHPLILKWLCNEKVTFTPSTSFFDEIVRFLAGTGNKHSMHHSWSLIKKGSSVSIEKKRIVIG